MSVITPLKNDIYQIELMDNGVPLRSSAYLIDGVKKIIIEPGAAPSNAQIKKALKELKISQLDIDAIMVTHIHLDHAGGAGLLMQQCRNATLYVHPRGYSHLINPDNLIKGTRTVYGDLFDRLFDPVLPVEEDRVKAFGDDDTFDMGGGRQLKILESLGHALHHVVIYDPLSKGIFCGDSAGIYYRPIYEQHGIPFSVPSTSPSQYDPDSMIKSLQQMIDLKPDRLYYTHYGMAEPALPQLQMALKMMPFFGEECVDFYKKAHSIERLTDLIRDTLYSQLKKMGVSKNSPALESLDPDLILNAQGIAAYVDRLERT